MPRITKYASVLLVVAGLVFGLNAQADQTFTFSDDFSSTNHLDLSNTIATIANGRVYNTPGSLNSSVVSTTIAFTSGNIVTVKVDPAAYLPAGSSVVYYVSNDNGGRWVQVNPGYAYTFDILGNQLIWRAVISRQNTSIDPYLDAITVTYTVGSQIVPANNSYNYGGGFGFGGGSVFSGGSDIWGRVCGTLSSLGLNCSNSTPPAYQPVAAGSGSTLGSIFGGSAAPAPAPVADTSSGGGSSVDSSALTAAIYTAGQKQEGSDSVNLVRVKGKEEIYEIVGGKKHFIPTMDIFFDYGFQPEWVEEITQQQLDKFPRVKLMQVTGDKKKTYYFTEGGMIRLIADKNVFNSYGDREEDIIVISKKEFNWYPRNQFVFLENPLNRDVYQIIGGKTKRYLTQAAVKRMKISPNQIAPINQTELATYQTDKPVIL